MNFWIENIYYSVSSWGTKNLLIIRYISYFFVYTRLELSSRDPPEISSFMSTYSRYEVYIFNKRRDSYGMTKGVYRLCMYLLYLLYISKNPLFHYSIYYTYMYHSFWRDHILRRGVPVYLLFLSLVRYMVGTVVVAIVPVVLPVSDCSSYIQRVLYLRIIL
jgi:hypothetical protein